EQSMRAIETTAKVGNDRKINLLLELPADVSPGDYTLLIMVEEKTARQEGSEEKGFDCLAWNWTASSTGESYRREDIYGDNGR
ncbi:MAG: hypothetical protein Q8M56_01060, partial [Desulfobacterales bacterium]|nr:hypothetical protein [Desulfobacterales bacterium]